MQEHSRKQPVICFESKSWVRPCDNSKSGSPHFAGRKAPRRQAQLPVPSHTFRNSQEYKPPPLGSFFPFFDSDLPHVISPIGMTFHQSLFHLQIG